MLLTDLDEFTRHYIIAALWAENDQSDPETGGDPLDDNFDIEDIVPECLAVMIADCAKFQEENADDIATWEDGEYTAEEMGGHDFWLTRNGHGAGFWDGDWEKEVGARLTKACEAFGKVDLYVGDDKKIYC